MHKPIRKVGLVYFDQSERWTVRLVPVSLKKNHLPNDDLHHHQPSWPLESSIIFVRVYTHPCVHKQINSREFIAQA